MKRRIITMTVCAAALAASVLSCKKETPASQPAETGDGISISVQGSIEDLTPADGVKASAGSVVRVKWEADDAVFVYDGANYLGTLDVKLKDNDARYAYMSGTLSTSPQSGTTELTLVYIKGQAANPPISGGKISIDLSAQDGEDFPFVLYGTLDYESGAETIEDRFVPFEFATSALKVNCFGLGSGDIAAASLSGVNTKCELSISKDAAPTVSGTTPGTITRSGEGVFSSKTSDGRAAFVMGVVKTDASEASDRNLSVTMEGGCTYGSAFSGSALSAAESINGVYSFALAYDPIAYVEISARYDGVNMTTLKWAKDNLAITPSGKREYNGTGHVIGDYFQWGAYKGYCGNEGDPDKGLLVYNAFSHKLCGDMTDSFEFKTGKSFVIENAPHYSGSAYDKYTGSDNKPKLESSDDAATIMLTGSWRMPKKEEFEAMKNATYWAWDATDKGYYVYTPDPSTDAGKVNSGTGTYVKTEALLFFPAAGYGYGSSLNIAGTYGFYWSSTLNTDNVDSAYNLSFSSGNVNPSSSNYRYSGRSVRPVSD